MRSSSAFAAFLWQIPPHSRIDLITPTVEQPIRLPNGDIGEVRLLNGDGIMVADPVRAGIVDPQNKLLRRPARKRMRWQFACDADRHCLIVDLIHDRVFELDPAPHLRNGPTTRVLRREK